MQGVLGLLAIGGLGICLLLLLLAVTCNWVERYDRGDNDADLLLILRDYGGQVEGLLRWLQFRYLWWERPLEIEIAVEPSQDNTLGLLIRLQRQSYPFRLLLIDSGEKLLPKHQGLILSLTDNEPIPWKSLEQAIKDYKRMVS